MIVLVKSKFFCTLNTSFNVLKQYKCVTRYLWKLREFRVKTGLKRTRKENDQTGPKVGPKTGLNFQSHVALPQSCRFCAFFLYIFHVIIFGKNYPLAFKWSIFEHFWTCRTIFRALWKEGLKNEAKKREVKAELKSRTKKREAHFEVTMLPFWGNNVTFLR